MAEHPAPEVLARDRAVAALAVLSGATDAISFLALGSAFTSVMTGNLVLVGVAAGSRDATALGVVATALVAYVVGVAVGARVAGRPHPGDNVWPARINVALGLELVLLAVYAVGWWALDSEPRQVWVLPLLALSATALGIQASAILRFGVSGMSSTYLTGTLTTLVAKVAADLHPRGISRSARILAALVVGATAGAALVSFARPVVPAFQLVLLLAVLVTGRHLSHRPRGGRR
ncbi:DUF1275 domain-containing protein [Mumia quercus]|uniref:DUF1275 domain-containing protein n=1 Tax=Mumia quercus TaxID=2976125 RepID=UPI0021D3754E|nr:DUF1275 domain-containing protein [Mumia quercus]